MILVMQRRWLAARLDKDGRVIGVSAGIGPRGKSHYAARPAGTYTWGTGALLLAACASAESGW
jgi:hypothetical protein